MVSAVRSQASRDLMQLIHECAELELWVCDLGSVGGTGPAYRFTLESPPPTCCDCPGECCTAGRIDLKQTLHRIIGQAARHRLPGELIRFDDEQVVTCAAKPSRSRNACGHCNRQFHIRVKGMLKRFGRC